MTEDKDPVKLIGIMPDKKPELIGFIEENEPSLLGFITPAIAYVIPVPEVPSYEGPFIFTPSDNEQTINVAEHIVQNDILITEIPFAEVSNPSGGYTVTIGE